MMLKQKNETYNAFRGIHLYMPSPEHMEECKRLFDVLSYLKYNTVILEVGGTMELEKHPEVNEAWTSFCNTLVKKFPGGPQNFQWSNRYWHDSTHYENARGKIVTKEAVRDLVQYARKVGLNVIPEIPALSHCYYLTLAHREIAEDKNDFFPDTYCPSNEESYKLYFEVAEEILEVIKPQIVSIGHDEIRTMAECPICRQKSAHELLAYEINRLHSFYKEKNIRIMMWCEKLLQPLPEYDYSRGKEDIIEADDYGHIHRVPAMYGALQHIPKDIIMLDWFHSQSPKTEQCFADRDFDVVFGNFSGIIFGKWDKRKKYVQGAEISTWCTPDEFTLGRDGILFDLIFTSLLFSNADYDDNKYEEYLHRAMNIVEPVRNIMRGINGNRCVAPENIEMIYLPEKGAYHISEGEARCYGSNAKILLEKCRDMSGISLGVEHMGFNTDIYAESLLLCEAFYKAEEQYMSYTFINTPYWEYSPMSDSNYLCCNMPKWSIATHEILYEDGSWELVNAVYGITAAAVDMKYAREIRYMDEKVNEIDDAIEKTEGERKPAPHYKLSDNWQTSALYFSDTIIFGKHTAYVYEWKNPHPEKKIVRINYVSTTHDKNQCLIIFGLGYIPVNI